MIADLNNWLGNIENRKTIVVIAIATMPVIMYFGNIIYYRIINRIVYRRIKISLEKV